MANEDGNLYKSTISGAAKAALVTLGIAGLAIAFSNKNAEAPVKENAPIVAEAPNVNYSSLMAGLPAASTPRGRNSSVIDSIVRGPELDEDKFKHTEEFKGPELDEEFYKKPNAETPSLIDRFTNPDGIKNLDFFMEQYGAKWRWEPKTTRDSARAVAYWQEGKLSMAAKYAEKTEDNDLKLAVWYQRADELLDNFVSIPSPSLDYYTDKVADTLTKVRQYNGGELPKALKTKTRLAILARLAVMTGEKESKEAKGNHGGYGGSVISGNSYGGNNGPSGSGPASAILIRGE